MLVLTRRPGESIVVDGPAVITIVETQGKKTRVGIEADPSVRITRSELLGGDQAPPQVADGSKERPAIT